MNTAPAGRCVVITRPEGESQRLAALIRDAGGELAWIENRNLNERRTVLVKPALADVRASADDKAPLVFQAEQNVVLDLNDLSGTGWARVTHRDGQSGYIKVTAVWGL